MADSPNLLSTMTGYHKKVYGDKLDQVIPASSVIYDLVEFEEAKKIGDSYNFPVLLTLENGFTVNGTAGAIVTLNDAANATMKEASIQGVELIGRVQMAYLAAARATAEGPAAFGRAWGQALMNLRVSHMKRLELMLLYGQLGLGVVETLASDTVTVSSASWSPATWIGLEGALFDFWTTSATGATQHGETTGSTLNVIDFTAQTLEFAASGPSGDTTVDADDVIYFHGARAASTYNECVGLMKIAQNTGTLFGVAGASYAIWQGNIKSSFGAMTMGKLLDAVSLAVDRGLDEKVVLLVCPKAYEVLNADLSASRHFDGSYSREKGENGTQSIVYNGQMGQVEVKVHPFLRRGESVAFPASQMKLIGSTDVGMGVPGTDGRDIFFHIQTKNAIEARSFSDLALLCLAPARCVAITGITYS
jgi:hypothetical protein